MIPLSKRLAFRTCFSVTVRNLRTFFFFGLTGEAIEREHQYLNLFCLSFLIPKGSFATASCIRCGNQVKGDDIKDSIFKQEVAYCKSCKTPSPPPKAKGKSKKRYSSSDEDESEEEDEDRLKGLMKPDIVFFGEKLPNAFDKSLKEDREQVDLLIVMGSSLKVAPVSDIMRRGHSVLEYV